MLATDLGGLSGFSEAGCVIRGAAGEDANAEEDATEVRVRA